MFLLRLIDVSISVVPLRPLIKQSTVLETLVNSYLIKLIVIKRYLNVLIEDGVK